jgi:hypothetical protein
MKRRVVVTIDRITVDSGIAIGEHELRQTLARQIGERLAGQQAAKPGQVNTLTGQIRRHENASQIVAGLIGDAVSGKSRRQP